MSGPLKSPQWGYVVSFGWLPPTCLNSISAGLLGGARSSGCLPSEFLREGLAPWSSRTDTSSGLDRRAAMCRGESPPTLLFTQAPGGERGPMRCDVLTLYRWGENPMGQVRAWLPPQQRSTSRRLDRILFIHSKQVNREKNVIVLKQNGYFNSTFSTGAFYDMYPGD